MTANSRFSDSWFPIRETLHVTKSTLSSSRQISSIFLSLSLSIPLFSPLQRFRNDFIDLGRNKTKVHRRDRPEKITFRPWNVHSLSSIKCHTTFIRLSLWGIASRKLFIVVRTRLFVRIDIKDRQKAVWAFK